ncbi:voltage-gated potassium channel [Gracilibacillus orientalis]|uniref:Voltage-gated potassium channel n=1 Tax=Gracilibacillus orientalis TaxID=334253 RepID=A0A1I4R769_9BACI|nr:potassium channel family protein [Gracilibacillus orientalis]SFM48101.1 voltage-gated potassium channel [Gracilibacillus orientalis]
MLWNRWVQFYFHLPIIIRLLLSVTFLMLSFGYLIHLIEPDHFPSTFDGIWWAFVTGSTVGYGDYVPLSSLGKIIAILLILAGGGFVTFYMATLSAGTIKLEQDLSKGKITYKGTNHTIIIGWNERTKQLIEMFKDHNLDTDTVLIDHTLNKLSYQDHQIHFINGEPTSDKTLKKANIEQAKNVVITSDPTLTEEEADRQTILNIIAARGNNPSIHIISEILTEMQKKNATRAGTDVVLRSNNFMSSLFYQSLFQKDPQATDIIAETLEEQQYCSELIGEDLIHKDFYFCAQQFLVERKWLIGLVRENEIILHPDFTSPMKKGDSLIFLRPLDHAQNRVK